MSWEPTMTDPQTWLEGLDTPRPLSAAIREQLETQLLGAQQPRPLEATLAAKLSDELTDPVADLLHDLDAPRPLSPQLRIAMASGLTVSRRRWLVASSAAASVAAAVVVATVVLSGAGPSRPSPDFASGPPGVRASATPTVDVGIAPGDAVTGTGAPVLPPEAVGVLAPPPAAVAPDSEVPGSHPVAGGAPASYGYYQPPDSPPAAMPADGGPPPKPAPTPEVTSRSPDAGPVGGGTTVRIRGSRLGAAERITFGDAVGSDLQVIDEGHLTVVSPPHPAGRVSFVVHFHDGGAFVVRDGFSYLKAPHLDSVSPTSSPSRGGEWVVLSGDALSRVTTVRFGNQVATTIEVVSDTTLRVLTPAHSIGAVDVTAISPGGTSNAVRFLYLP